MLFTCNFKCITIGTTCVTNHVFLKFQIVSSQSDTSTMKSVTRDKKNMLQYIIIVTLTNVPIDKKLCYKVVTLF